MGFVDRFLTIVVTATLTSAAWIVAGSSFLDRAGDSSPTVTSPDTTNAAAGAREEKAGGAVTKGTVAIPQAAGKLLIPVAGIAASALTDTFSDSRANGQRLHEAIDIMAPTGTPVVAAAPGTVEKLFRSAAGGNTIYVRSADRQTIHYYAHLDQYAGGLKEGQQVTSGQQLGTVGSSGNASDAAPHLHFAVLQTEATSEWWEPAVALNPYPLLTGR